MANPAAMKPIILHRAIRRLAIDVPFAAWRFADQRCFGLIVPVPVAAFVFHPPGSPHRAGRGFLNGGEFAVVAALVKAMDEHLTATLDRVTAYKDRSAFTLGWPERIADRRAQCLDEGGPVLVLLFGWIRKIKIADQIHGLMVGIFAGIFGTAVRNTRAIGISAVAPRPDANLGDRLKQEALHAHVFASSGI